MRKKILAFILAVSMVVQNSAMTVQAAESPAYQQTEETVENGEGLTETVNTKADSEENNNSEDAPTENTEQTDAEADTPEDSEKTDNEEGTTEDSLPEDNDEADAENTISENNAENDTENIVSEDDKESQTDAEAESDPDPAPNPQEESVGTPAYKDLEADGQKDGENVQTVQYAQYVADSQTAGGTIKADKGLYFGYTEKDTEKHTGILSEYLSESGEIVIPHKLGNYYMVGIGEKVFANMNKTDPSDTSKLPSQSTSGKTLLSSGEEKILESVNAARMKEGKIPLVMSSTLRKTARCKTLDMLNKNYFSHDNPGGGDTSNWLKNCGYPWLMWAENIAYNYESAERLYTQWWNSPGHKSNMMNGNLRAIGIGVYQGSDGKIMGTQVFTSTVFQNLTKVEIAYGYEFIGAGAFQGCSNLKVITIPSTVTEIADDAFKDCGTLVICGKAGSYAQTYANEKEFSFQAIEETCPIKYFGYDQEKNEENAEIFLEKGDMDSVYPIIDPVDYEHLIKEERPEEQSVVRFLEDGAILALENGSLTLRATAGDLTRECKITVGDRNVPLEEISFYEEEIMLYEGESAKPFYRLSPADTTDAVQLSTSDEDVFVIEKKNGDTVITAVHAGTAKLTVSNEDGSKSAELPVKVYAVQADLVLPNDLKAVTNITGTLADVSLDGWPGFSWKEPQTKLKAKKGEPVQYFAAQYSDGAHISQDCILPVAVSSVSGLTVSMAAVKPGIESPVSSGWKTLASANKLSLSENYEIMFGTLAVGAEVDPAFYEVNYSMDHPETAEMEKSSRRILPKAAGKCTLTVEIRLKDAAGSYGPAKKPYGTYQKKYTLQIEEKTYVQSFQFRLESDGSEPGAAGVKQQEDGSFLVEDGVTKFYVRALAFDINGAAEPVAETALGFGVDKSGVLKVKAVKGQNGLAEVTVKKPGNAIITVTAKDNGKRSESVLVHVQNLSPQLKGKTWTLNKLKPKVAAAVDLKESESNPILSVKLYEDKEQQIESALFSIQKNGDFYTVGFQNQATEQVTKGSYKLYLQIITQEKREPYLFPITIKLANKKPTVTLKQSAGINLFYKDADARLTVSIGAEKLKFVAGTEKPKIEQVNEVKDAPHFRIDENSWEQDGAAFTGMITPVGVTLENYKKINKKIELRFYFEDYGEEFFITKTLTVKSSYQKVSLTTTPTAGLVYQKIGNDRAMFRIMEKKGKNILIPGKKEEGKESGNDRVTIELEENMKTKAYLITEDGNPDITLWLLGDKSLTVKTKVSHDNWRESVPCSFKMTVNKKTPTLALDKTKVSFNSNAAGKETFYVQASTSKNDIVSIVRLKDADIVGNNAAAKKLLEEGKITISPQKQGNGRRLVIRLNDTSVRNGTYKYKVYGWCMLGETKILRMNPVTLSITVSNKQPAVSLKAKGKLKLSAPDESVITYTPKISNVTGDIQNAALSGAYASAFQLISCEDGTYQVKLKRGDLTKGSYKLYFVFTLDNGVRITSKAVTIKL